jgi:hypothetical protein
VQLDDARLRSLDRVVQRDRRVRIRAGVENDADQVAGNRFASRLLNPVDELSFVIRLRRSNATATISQMINVSRELSTQYIRASFLNGIKKTGGGEWI